MYTILFEITRYNFDFNWDRKNSSNATTSSWLAPVPPHAAFSSAQLSLRTLASFASRSLSSSARAGFEANAPDAFAQWSSWASARWSPSPAAAARCESAARALGSSARSSAWTLAHLAHSRSRWQRCRPLERSWMWSRCIGRCWRRRAQVWAARRAPRTPAVATAAPRTGCSACVFWCCFVGMNGTRPVGRHRRRRRGSRSWVESALAGRLWLPQHTQAH